MIYYRYKIKNMECIMSFFKKIFGVKKNVEENYQASNDIKKIEIEEQAIELVESTLNEETSNEETSKNSKEIIEFEEKKEVITEIKNTKKGFFSSLKDKLFNSREGLFKSIKATILGRAIIDNRMYEELEEVLIQSDIGMETTIKIIETLEKEIDKRKIKNSDEVYLVLKEIMESLILSENNELKIFPDRMNVILVVGVNGVGKTTTIGKLASKYTNEGKKVIIGAADTFRAAAVEQIEEWAKRSGATLVKSEKDGGDPGAVVFDTLKRAEEERADIVIIDTAGRLHNKINLMAELEKINTIIKKKIGDVEYETLLVIDGTTGQNGLIQAKLFNEATKLTGFIITKLDGTAKGGIVFSVSETLKKPIKYIGVGEKIEDLREFNSKEYVEAIFN
jgi:fused signal recognition particle receptor